MQYQILDRGHNRWVAAFASAQLGQNMDYEWLPTLEKLPVNVIALMDDKRTWWHACYDEVLELLTPHSPLCIGASMGGYGALMFAEQMGTKAIAFGPQTVLSSQGKASLKDTRWEDLHHNVRKIAVKPLDLTCSGEKYQIHYCTHFLLDKLHAERLDVLKTAHPCTTHHVSRSVDLVKLLR